MGGGGGFTLAPAEVRELRAVFTPLLVPMTTWARELPALTGWESYSYLGGGGWVGGWVG